MHLSLTCVYLRNKAFGCKHQCSLLFVSRSQRQIQRSENAVAKVFAKKIKKREILTFYNTLIINYLQRVYSYFYRRITSYK